MQLKNNYYYVHIAFFLLSIFKDNINVVNFNRNATGVQPLNCKLVKH